MLREEE